MPINTEHYLLESFIDGDSYISVSDFRRFSTVDNQLWRIAEFTKDGVINGWSISFEDSSIIISSGNGIIDGYYVNTFNEFVYNPVSAGIIYIYAQKKNNIIGTEGPKSDIKTITYTDDGPPSSVIGFSYSNLTYNSVSLNWQENNEIDFDKYVLYRSIDGVDYELLTETSDHLYIDNLEEDTLYYYSIKAKDKTGNLSSPSILSLTSLLSVINPPDPFNPVVRESESGLNIVWEHPFGIQKSKIKNYKIILYTLNSDNSIVLSSYIEHVISKDLLYDRIDYLLNGTAYKITIKTVDYKDRESDGISLIAVPQPSIAPRDPDAIVFSFEEALGEGVLIKLDWTDGDSIYDPATSYRYKVYVTVDSNPESLPFNVPVGKTSFDLSVYSFDYSTYSPIPENTLVTIRITSLSQEGYESFGSVVRFRTPYFSKPSRIQEFTSSFNEDGASISLNWKNNADTASLNLKIYRDYLNDEYNSNEIIFNKNIGLVNHYIFSNAELDARYTFVLTPYNTEDIVGDYATSVTLSLFDANLPLPLPPARIQAQTGDRQAIINWESSLSPYVKYYYIYKKEGTVSLTFADWELLDKVPSNIISFVDYGLTNNTIYSYYIISEDIYGRKSLHLPDGAISLNYIEALPQSQGNLTPPYNITTTLLGNGHVLLEWESLPEEFESYSIYRSVNNLYDFKLIKTVDKSTDFYVDTELPLIDNYSYHYVISKNLNDAEIKFQSFNNIPENSIYLYKVTYTGSSFSYTPQYRDIKNFNASITELSNKYLLGHKHRELSRFDPERINLSDSIVVDQWSTYDGRIWFCEEDINGSNFILKVNDRFPRILYSIDAVNKKIIFSEPIATLDSDGNINESIAISLEVFGIDEVDNILQSSRINGIHANQIAFGNLSKEQIPDLNHEGRIKEGLIPKRFLLEKLNNWQFIIPQGNQDSSKTFSNSLSFFCVKEADGHVEKVVDFDLYKENDSVLFRSPLYDTTSQNLNISYLPYSKIIKDGFNSLNSLKISFKFLDSDENRWIKVVSENTDIKPNPVLNLKKRLQFRILNTVSNIYLTIGIREVQGQYNVGDNGGIIGPIEFVNIQELNNGVPKGILIKKSTEWQLIDIDFSNTSIISYIDGNSVLSSDYGVLQHFAFTIDPTDSNCTEIINIQIDNLVQVNDIIVAGTSQGIRYSDDFGSSWSLSRYTATPVHKIIQSKYDNSFWCISSDQVFYSFDPVSWFSVKGVIAQSINDIIEDSFGNIFVSTNKGVFVLERFIFNIFPQFKQTNPVDSFSSNCFGLYKFVVSSGAEEIWVSTENGIFSTLDLGNIWINTNLYFNNLQNYKFLDYNNDIYTFNKIQILKYVNNDFQEIHNVSNEIQANQIYDIAFCNGDMYIFTDTGIYIKNNSDLNKIITDKLYINNILVSTFSLNVITDDSTENLWICQENRIIVLDGNNVCSTKFINNNEDIGFYINDKLISYGYTFNSFNNIICFKDARLLGDIVSCEYLPRVKYLTQNGGWAFTNSEADVFIYKNGLPQWIDWKIDSNDVYSEFQLISSYLNIIELDDFNSNLTKATIYKNLLLDYITALTAASINKEAIAYVLQNYSIFLSLISDSAKIIEYQGNTVKISLPSIILNGISRNDRVNNSRSALFELKNDFVSQNSTNIIIDSLLGEVDFSVALAQADVADKGNYTFTKYDYIQADIFNVNISNTGEYTHREIEDQFESINTGLTSGLSDVFIDNLIKTGIFIEKNNLNIFDNNNISLIQSKFYSVNSVNWYQRLNSTIDYPLTIDTGDNNVFLYTNSILVINDEYNVNTIFLATNNNIYEYKVLNNMINFNKIIKIRNSSNIKNIYNINNEIYIVSNDLFKSYIDYSDDFGETWKELGNFNLPNNFDNIFKINNLFISSSDQGLFYNDNQSNEWFKASLDISDAVQNKQLAKDYFSLISNNIFVDQFVFMESGLYFYRGNGIQFYCNGNISNNNVSVVSKILRFKNITYVATDKGLYNDANTLLSDSIQFGLEDIEKDLNESVKKSINDIYAYGDALFCCSTEGCIYKYYDFGNGNEWKKLKIQEFDTITHIAVNDNYIFVVSFNKIKILANLNDNFI